MTLRCKTCQKFIANDQEYCSDHSQNTTTLHTETDTYSQNTTTLQNSFEEAESSAIATGNRVNLPYTVEELIELFKVDLAIWDIERIITNSWDVTNKNGETYKNYQTKLSFIRKKLTTSYEQIREDFLEFAKYKSPKFTKKQYDFKQNVEDNLLEIDIMDLHLGKLCWEQETGENYDTKIARHRFLTTIQKIINRAKSFSFNRIVFPVGSDFFNADNLRNETTYGTAQDCDLRWQKLYKMGRELLVDAIEYLKQFAPVDVVVIQGNHDFERMFYLGDSLSLYYENDINVNVNNQPKSRKYYKYGSVMLGFTHGGEEKVADLPLLMANEASDIWSSTKFREMHIGHLHHKKEIKYMSTQEYTGVVVRMMRTLSSADAWHTRKGFVGNVKGSEAFIWNSDCGLIASFECNLNL